MSNALKVGDRVKIVPNAKDEILIPYQMPDALAERIEELTAVITEVHKCRIATVRFDTGSYYMDFSNLQRIPDTPSRTFEEIVKELGANKIITDFYCIDQDFPCGDNRDKSCEFFGLDADENSYVGFEMYDDGHVRLEDTFSASQLAAIAAACQEIADGRKEDTRHA